VKHTHLDVNSYCVSQSLLVSRILNKSSSLIIWISEAVYILYHPISIIWEQILTEGYLNSRMDSLWERKVSIGLRYIWLIRLVKISFHLKIELHTQRVLWKKCIDVQRTPRITWIGCNLTTLGKH
jgi:hypothetical protein